MKKVFKFQKNDKDVAKIVRELKWQYPYEEAEWYTHAAWQIVRHDYNQQLRKER